MPYTSIKFSSAIKITSMNKNRIYLGIHFTASGTFSFVKNELYKKGLKAYFKLRKDFLSFKPWDIN